MMRVAISGASGFVGSHLGKYFAQQGDDVIPLPRTLFAESDRTALSEVLSQCDVVVNLAGASLDKRWTDTYKREIHDSRILTTRALVEAINALKVKPGLLISASAVGYYPSSGCYAESDAKRGTGFLSDVCRDWEAEVARVSPDVRRVVARFAVVLSPDGGAFPKIAYAATHRVAVQFASGTQNFAWVDLQDLLRAIDFIVTHSDVTGVVNIVAPRRINNAQLTRAVAGHFKSWLTLPLPAFVLHLAFGDSAQLLLNGQCAYPEKLLAHGFTFESNSINDFLEKL